MGFGPSIFRGYNTNFGNAFSMMLVDDPMSLQQNVLFALGHSFND